MKLYFTQKAYAQLVQLIQLSEQELNGWEVQAFGRIEARDLVDPEASPIQTVTELSLPPQVSRSTEIDSTLDELIEWQQLQWNLSNPPTDDEISVMNVELPQWRLWIHTHPGGTTYSAKDEETLARLASEMTGDWFVGLCINKKLEHTVYIGGAKPWPHCAVVLNSGIETLRVQNDEFTEQFKDRVTKYSYQSTHYKGPGSSVSNQPWNKKTHDVPLIIEAGTLTKAAVKRGVCESYETEQWTFELRVANPEIESYRQCTGCKTEDGAIWAELWKRAKKPVNAPWISELGPAFICTGCAERAGACDCPGAQMSLSERAMAAYGGGFYGYGVYGHEDS